MNDPAGRGEFHAAETAGPTLAAHAADTVFMAEEVGGIEGDAAGEEVDAAAGSGAAGAAQATFAAGEKERAARAAEPALAAGAAQALFPVIVPLVIETLPPLTKRPPPWPEPPWPPVPPAPPGFWCGK